MVIYQILNSFQIAGKEEEKVQTECPGDTPKRYCRTGLLQEPLPRPQTTWLLTQSAPHILPLGVHTSFIHLNISHGSHRKMQLQQEQQHYHKQTQPPYDHVHLTYFTWCV